MDKQDKKIFIRSFGCQMNDADSEVMVRLLEREGYRKIDSPERADIIILKRIIKYCIPRTTTLLLHKKFMKGKINEILLC